MSLASPPLNWIPRAQLCLWRRSRARCGLLALVTAGIASLSVSSSIAWANDKSPVGLQELYGASHALVIGADTYQDSSWPRLSNGIRDAKAVADALKSTGFEITFVQDPTKTELIKAFEDFIYGPGADPNARLVIWFAGHGHTLTGEGYIVPVDAPGLADEAAFRKGVLSMRRFGEYMREVRARHVMAIFDSCFSGTVFDTARARVPAGITKATAAPVRQFISSGEASQEVSDDGLFRRLFIGALNGQETQADTDGDGYVTGSELGLFLEQRVTSLTEARQTPRSGKLRAQGLDQGDIVFTLPAQSAPSWFDKLVGKSPSKPAVAPAPQPARVVTPAPQTPPAPPPSQAPTVALAIPPKPINSVSPQTAAAPPPEVKLAALPPLGTDQVRSCVLAARQRGVDAVGRGTFRLTSSCGAIGAVVVRYGTWAFRQQPVANSGEVDITIDLFAGPGRVTFDAGQGQIASLEADGGRTEEIVKFVLVWNGAADLDLHALQFGARFGDADHIWVGRPRSLSEAVQGSTGFISSADDGALMGDHSEVYTFIKSVNHRRGGVQLRVDYKSRGDVPTGAFCGSGAMARVDFKVLRFERGRLEPLNSGYIKARDCGAALTLDARYAPVPAPIRFE